MGIVMRRIGLAALLGACLASAGCAGGNDSEADRLQASLGPVPTSEVKGGEESTQPGSMEEYERRQKEQHAQDPGGSDYARQVGAKK